MDAEIDTSKVNTTHAQIKLGQHLADNSQPPTQGNERDLQTGQFLAGNKANEIGLGGRPTIYSADLCEDLIDYFNIDPNREVIITQHFGKDNITETPKEVANDLPTLEGWCQKHNLWPQRVSEWAKRFPEFAEALMRAKAIQKHLLIVNGLKGLYDSRAFIFVAINNTDMKNKTLTEESGERKVIVEHRDYINERRIIDAEPVSRTDTLDV